MGRQEALGCNRFGVAVRYVVLAAILTIYGGQV